MNNSECNLYAQTGVSLECIQWLRLSTCLLHIHVIRPLHFSFICTSEENQLVKLNNTVIAMNRPWNQQQEHGVYVSNLNSMSSQSLNKFIPIYWPIKRQQIKKSIWWFPISKYMSKKQKNETTKKNGQKAKLWYIKQKIRYLIHDQKSLQIIILLSLLYFPTNSFFGVGVVHYLKWNIMLFNSWSV